MGSSPALFVQSPPPPAPTHEKPAWGSAGKVNFHEAAHVPQFRWRGVLTTHLSGTVSLQLDGCDRLGQCSGPQWPRTFFVCLAFRVTAPLSSGSCRFRPVFSVFIIIIIVCFVWYPVWSVSALAPAGTSQPCEIPLPFHCTALHPFRIQTFIQSGMQLRVRQFLEQQLAGPPQS